MEESTQETPAQFVRFRVNNPERFAALQTLFNEVKKDKDAEEFREPEDVKPNFSWPTQTQRQDWLERRPYTPIAVCPPQYQFSQRWDFYRVFEAFEDGEYSLLTCDMTGKDTAEMRIDTWAYPYGGVGCMIALAEAFEFEVLGVNECGIYESREELLGLRESDDL